MRNVIGLKIAVYNLHGKRSDLKEESIHRLKSLDVRGEKGKEGISDTRWHLFWWQRCFPAVE